MSSTQLLHRTRGLELELSGRRLRERRPCRPTGPDAALDGPARERAIVHLERVGGDGALLRVAGELDISSLPALDAVLRKVERWAIPSLLVDAGEVGFIDLSAIGWLVRANARLAAAGGSLLVVHPPECLLRILAVVDVDLPVLQ